MSKMLTVASVEFATLVRSKAFLITLVLMPVIMAVSFLLMRMTRNASDTTERRFAYIDQSGVAGAVLEAAAAERNLTADAERIPRFVPLRVDERAHSRDDLRIELSDRVRAGELFAFVEIPAAIVDPDADVGILYYSDHPSYDRLPVWLMRTINQAVSKGVLKKQTASRYVSRLAARRAED